MTRGFSFHEFFFGNGDDLAQAIGEMFRRNWSLVVLRLAVSVFRHSPGKCSSM